MVRSKNDDGDPSTDGSPLILGVPVGRYQHVERRSSGLSDKVSVRDLRPAEVARERHIVSRERLPQSDRNVLVKQNARHGAGRKR